MSEFLLAGYNREDAAAHVLGVLRAHSDDLAIDLDSTGIVRVGADGRFTVTTMAGPGTHRGTSWAVLWSALFELVFAVPVAGTAYGSSLGGVFGALERAGIDTDVRTRVRDMLGPRTSGLAFLTASVDPEPVLDRLSVHPTAVLRVLLSAEQDAELVMELGGIPSTEPHPGGRAT